MSRWVKECEGTWINIDQFDQICVEEIDGQFEIHAVGKEGLTVLSGDYATAATAAMWLDKMMLK